jgi:Ca-activated chloride channel family protein
VKQTMDKQLQGQRKPASHMLGTPRDEPGAHLPQAMRQELQRVPDDPGGLLRRKFLLEYQQRQQGSGGQP